MLFKQRLQMLLDARRMKPIDLARRAEIPQSTVYSWLQKGTEPHPETRKKVADALGVTEAELFEAARPEEDVLGGVSTVEDRADSTRIPLLSVCPASPANWTSDELERFIEFPKDEIRGRRVYLLRVRGDSMNSAKPVPIENNDVVFVVVDTQPLDGDIVVVRINQYDCTLKRYSRINGQILLTPESSNPSHKPIILDSKDHVLLRGVVESIWQKRIRKR